MRLSPLTCLILTSLTATALPAAADAVLERARTASKEGPPYILDMVYERGSERFQMTVDQSRPEGQRVTAFSPDPASLTGDAASRAERLKARTTGEIWCSGFAANIPANARRVSEAGGRATYRFTPLPGPDDSNDIASAYRHLEATAVIDTASGQIFSYQMSAPRSFKPNLAAKVDSFSLEVTCKPAPDGRTHVETYRMRLAGSAMMQSFNQDESRRISNLRPAPVSGTGSR
ncbi:hypothetical protein [Hyphomonas sp.]|uniref:hypothetical protein n=1 Tax=Hyphomonas sp. TaxID=87 RepID=UPI00391BC80A